jgi:hypothetical protein
MEKIKELSLEFVEKFKALEQNLTENLTGFSIDQVKNAQGVLKELEDKLKNNQIKKVKTITISEEVHTKVKKYCVDNGLKINEWVESKLVELIS